MTASPFEKRLQAAARHEDAVLRRFRESGWDAELFGQGQLSPTMRNHLRHINAPVRWMADIIAGRELRGCHQVVFVDAKAGTKWERSGNHDIEIAALDAAERWESLNSGCGYYFVFADWTVASCSAIKARGKRGPNYGNGSGTPYLVFPTDTGSPFDVVFPVVPCDVLDITPDPTGVLQVVGYDGSGASINVFWSFDVIEQALAEVAARGDDRIRMPGNGSPVLLECDLLEMQQAVRRAQERER